MRVQGAGLARRRSLVLRSAKQKLTTGSPVEKCQSTDLPVLSRQPDALRIHGAPKLVQDKHVVPVWSCPIRHAKLSSTACIAGVFTTGSRYHTVLPL